MLPSACSGEGCAFDDVGLKFDTDFFLNGILGLLFGVRPVLSFPASFSSDYIIKICPVYAENSRATIKNISVGSLKHVPFRLSSSGRLRSGSSIPAQSWITAQNAA